MSDEKRAEQARVQWEVLRLIRDECSSAFIDWLKTVELRRVQLERCGYRGVGVVGSRVAEVK